MFLNEETRYVKTENYEKYCLLWNILLHTHNFVIRGKFDWELIQKVFALFRHFDEFFSRKGKSYPLIEPELFSQNEQISRTFRHLNFEIF